MRRRIFVLLLFLLVANAIPVGAKPPSPPDSHRIAGVVVDSVTGQPLEGATVTLALVSNLDEMQTFLTSADGRFVFADLAPDKYRLSAARRDYAPQSFKQHETFMTDIVTGPGLDTQHVRFRLSPSAVLTGVITDESGDPVREAKVLLFQQSMFDGSRTLRHVRETVPDDQGRYRFAHLRSGTYAVAVYARPWYTRDSAVGLIRYAQLAQVKLASRADLTDDAAIREYVRSLVERAQLDSASSLFDVVYPVTFFPSSASLADAGRLSLSPGATETADFHLRTVPSVHLRVSLPVQPPVSVTVSSEDGESREGETSSVELDSSASISASLRIGEDFADQLQPKRTEIAPGLIELSGIPPGEVSLTATSFLDRSAANYISRSKTLDVSGDTAINLTSQGSPTNVSGTVILPNSSGAAPATSALPPGISAFSDSTDTPSSLTISFRSLSSGETYDTPVSAKGTFSFPNISLPAGSYEVGFLASQEIQVSSIEATGATVSGRTVEIPADQPVTLVVHPAEAKATLSGLALKNGKPVAGAMVLLIPQDSGLAGPLYRRDQSNSDGSFSIGPLFPGRYTLLALENGWDLEWADPAVLFRYLPNGQPVEIPADGAVTHNAKVQ